jgi:hypothetical protein
MSESSEWCSFARLGDVKEVDSATDDGADVLADFQDRMIQSYVFERTGSCRVVVFALFRSKQMYGHGFGLPICRLYAQCFAGSLTLRQVPRIGTDVYLRLGFIHTKSERIRI